MIKVWVIEAEIAKGKWEPRSAEFTKVDAKETLENWYLPDKEFKYRIREYVRKEKA